MHKLSFCFKLLAVAAILFTLNACEDIEPPGPGGGGGTGNPADVFLGSGAGLVDFSATVNAADTFSVQLNASAGDSPINTVEVLEGGVLVSLDRLTINGNAGNNPALVLGDDKNALVWTIDVVAHTAPGTSTYEFLVTDDEARTNSSTVSITVDAAPPVLSVNSNPNIDACPSEGFLITMTAALGGSQLATIGVTESGNPVDIADLSYLINGGLVGFQANPDNLPASLIDGFTEQAFVIRAPSQSATYDITLTDVNGQTSVSQVSFTVDTNPVGQSASATMYNNSGAMFGGIDLDALLNVSSTNADADIVDAGNVGGVWQRKVVSDDINGAELRAIDDTAGCGISGLAFTDITFSVLVENAFNNGTPIGETATLNLGDRFTAQVNGNMYLLELVIIDESDAANDNEFMTFNIVRAR